MVVFFFKVQVLFFLFFFFFLFLPFRRSVFFQTVVDGEPAIVPDTFSYRRDQGIPNQDIFIPGHGDDHGHHKESAHERELEKKAFERWRHLARNKKHPVKVDSALEYKQLKTYIKSLIGRIYLNTKGKSGIVALIKGPPGKDGRNAADVHGLRNEVRRLTRMVRSLLHQLQHVKDIEQNLFPEWAQERHGACPDGWLYKGFTARDQAVWCVPDNEHKHPSPQNPICNKLAKFPRHYKRCAWAEYCQAPWSHYGCPYRLPEDVVYIPLSAERAAEQLHIHEEEEHHHRRQHEEFEPVSSRINRAVHDQIFHGAPAHHVEAQSAHALLRRMPPQQALQHLMTRVAHPSAGHAAPAAHKAAQAARAAAVAAAVLKHISTSNPRPKVVLAAANAVHAIAMRAVHQTRKAVEHLRDKLSAPGLSEHQRKRLEHKIHEVRAAQHKARAAAAEAAALATAAAQTSKAQLKARLEHTHDPAQRAHIEAKLEHVRAVIRKNKRREQHFLHRAREQAHELGARIREAGEHLASLTERRRELELKAATHPSHAESVDLELKALEKKLTKAKLHALQLERRSVRISKSVAKIEQVKLKLLHSELARTRSPEAREALHQKIADAKAHIRGAYHRMRALLKQTAKASQKKLEHQEEKVQEHMHKLAEIAKQFKEAPSAQAKAELAKEVQLAEIRLHVALRHLKAAKRGFSVQERLRKAAAVSRVASARRELNKAHTDEERQKAQEHLEHAQEKLHAIRSKAREERRRFHALKHSIQQHAHAAKAELRHAGFKKNLGMEKAQVKAHIAETKAKLSAVREQLKAPGLTHQQRHKLHEAIHALRHEVRRAKRKERHVADRMRAEIMRLPPRLRVKRMQAHLKNLHNKIHALKEAMHNAKDWKERHALRQQLHHARHQLHETKQRIVRANHSVTHERMRTRLRARREAHRAAAAAHRAGNLLRHAHHLKEKLANASEHEAARIRRKLRHIKRQLRHQARRDRARLRQLHRAAREAGRRIHTEKRSLHSVLHHIRSLEHKLDHVKDPVLAKKLNAKLHHLYKRQDHLEERIARHRETLHQVHRAATGLKRTVHRLHKAVGVHVHNEELPHPCDLCHREGEHHEEHHEREHHEEHHEEHREEHHEHERERVYAHIEGHPHPCDLCRRVREEERHAEHHEREREHLEHHELQKVHHEKRRIDHLHSSIREILREIEHAPTHEEAQHLQHKLHHLRHKLTKAKHALHHARLEAHRLLAPQRQTVWKLAEERSHIHHEIHDLKRQIREAPDHHTRHELMRALHHEERKARLIRKELHHAKEHARSQHLLTKEKHMRRHSEHLLRLLNHKLSHLRRLLASPDVKGVHRERLLHKLRHLDQRHHHLVATIAKAARKRRSIFKHRAHREARKIKKLLRELKSGVLGHEAAKHLAETLSHASEKRIELLHKEDEENARNVRTRKHEYHRLAEELKHLIHLSLKHPSERLARHIEKLRDSERTAHRKMEHAKAHAAETASKAAKKLAQEAKVIAHLIANNPHLADHLEDMKAALKSAAGAAERRAKAERARPIHHSMKIMAQLHDEIYNVKQREKYLHARKAAATSFTAKRTLAKEVEALDSLKKTLQSSLRVQRDKVRHLLKHHLHHLKQHIDHLRATLEAATDQHEREHLAHELAHSEEHKRRLDSKLHKIKKTRVGALHAAMIKAGEELKKARDHVRTLHAEMKLETTPEGRDRVAALLKVAQHKSKELDQKKHSLARKYAHHLHKRLHHSREKIGMIDQELKSPDISAAHRRHLMARKTKLEERVNRAKHFLEQRFTHQSHDKRREHRMHHLASRFEASQAKAARAHDQFSVAREVLKSILDQSPPKRGTAAYRTYTLRRLNAQAKLRDFFHEYKHRIHRALKFAHRRLEMLKEFIQHHPSDHDAQDRLNELHKHAEGLKRHLFNVKRQKKAVTARAHEIFPPSQAHRGQILHYKLTEARREKRQLKEKLFKLKAKLAHLEEREARADKPAMQAELKAEVKALKHHLHQAKHHFELKEALYRKLHAEKREAARKLVFLRNKAESLKEQKSTLWQERQELHLRIDRLESKLSLAAPADRQRLNDKLERERESAHRLSHKLIALREEIKKIERHAYGDTQSFHAASAADARFHEHKLRKAMKHVHHLILKEKLKVDSMQDTLASIADTKSAQYRQLEKDIAEAKNHLIALNIKMEAVKFEHKTAKIQALKLAHHADRDAERRRKERIQERRELRDQVHHAVRALGKAKAKEHHLDKVITELHSQITALRAQRDDAERKNLREAYDQFSEKLEHLIGKRSEAKDELRHLAHHIAKVTAEARDAEHAFIKKLPEAVRHRAKQLVKLEIKKFKAQERYHAIIHRYHGATGAERAALYAELQQAKVEYHEMKLKLDAGKKETRIAMQKTRLHHLKKKLEDLRAKQEAASTGVEKRFYDAQRRLMHREMGQLRDSVRELRAERRRAVQKERTLEHLHPIHPVALPATNAGGATGGGPQPSVAPPIRTP